MLSQAKVEALHAALLKAQGRNDYDATIETTKQLRSGMGLSKFMRKKRLAAQTQQKEKRSTIALLQGEMGKKRMVFVSLRDVERYYKFRMDQEDLKQCLIILSDAYWTAIHGMDRDKKVWRGNCQTILPGPAMKLEEELRCKIVEKHNAGTVFWVGKSENGKSFQQLSTWLTKQFDPQSGNRYKGLQLSISWWRHNFPSKFHEAKYTKSGEKVVRNIASLGMEPRSVLELLYQSNPTKFEYIYK